MGSTEDLGKVTLMARNALAAATTETREQAQGEEVLAELLRPPQQFRDDERRGMDIRTHEAQRDALIEVASHVARTSWRAVARSPNPKVTDR